MEKKLLRKGNNNKSLQWEVDPETLLFKGMTQDHVGQLLNHFLNGRFHKEGKPVVEPLRSPPWQSPWEFRWLNAAYEKGYDWLKSHQRYQVYALFSVVLFYERRIAELEKMKGVPQVPEDDRLTLPEFIRECEELGGDNKLSQGQIDWLERNGNPKGNWDYWSELLLKA
jgi:hypothetical protein